MRLMCILCPNGCELRVNGQVVSGNLCERGVEYVKAELEAPRRVVTTTVKLKGKRGVVLLPVKTSEPVPKGKVFDVVREASSLEVEPPVRRGQVLKKNIASTGADLIATKDVGS